jgi:hypothetical protein
MTSTYTSTTHYATKPVTTQPLFIPQFLNNFSGVANGLLDTSVRRQFAVGANSENNLKQSYIISANPSGDTTQPSTYSGILDSQYRGPEYDIFSTYYTDKSAGGDEISVVAKTLANGLIVKATAYSHNSQYGYDNYVGAVESTYATNQFALLTRVLSDTKKHTLEAFASAGRRLNANDTITVGGSVRASYANSNTTLESNDVGVHYSTTNNNGNSVGLTVKTSSNLSQVSTIVHQTISPNTTVAAKLDAPLKSLQSLPGYPRTLSLGVLSMINNYLVRGTANLGDGTIAASINKNINGYRVPGTVGITLKSSLNKTNLTGANAIDNVGIQFNFGSN